MDTNVRTETERLDFTHPTAECDLVMKGGITSGVVYPPAIVKLATRYRFRNIGGTSAGAIAAGAAAAAEYGRERGGFQHLMHVRDQLGKDKFIFDLFQPSSTTRPLLNVLFALAAEWKQETPWRFPRLGWRLTQALWHNQPKSFAQGALLSTGIAGLYAAFAGGARKPGLLPPLLLLGWIGGLAKGGYDLSQILLKEIPQNNFFGICTGLKDGSTDEGPEALTAWMSEQINVLAGRAKHDPPLTFRELSEKRVQDEDCSIRLRMVTTNLNQSRPYIIPFDTNVFLFRRSDMERLFPPNVVEYMIREAYPSKRISLDRLPDFYFLPEGDKLPVVVGMRLSLSFPLLISAVPFYTVKLSAYRRREKGKPLILEYDAGSEQGDLQKNWFSDGGICSNFPIHFFDAWLPRRPTFGINLSSLPEEAFEHDHSRIDPEYRSLGDGDEEDMDGAPRALDAAVISKAVYLPRANELLTTDWTKITSLLDFANAIFSSAQNYRDTMQAMLPSYRDRIVQVRFAPHEGGLNLAMAPETIKGIQQKGEEAAQKIFDFKLAHHQWVRFQVLIALMERQLSRLEQAIREANYEEIINQQALERAQSDRSRWYPYAQSQEWCDEAIKRIEALLEFIEKFDTQTWLVDHPPRPEAVLRVTPEV